MKQTLNINIMGRIFTIDVDAYDLLSEYLDTIHDAFRSQSYASELIQDLELRIAEIFTEIMETGASVIVLTDVRDVISRIGKPEEIIDTEITETIVQQEDGISDMKISQTTTVGSTCPAPPAIKRKFFRDPQERMLGGVCAGLAHYLNVDVVWVRLTFIAIMLLSVSTVFILYIILWIVVPEAKTPYQRMQMFGKNATIDNIGKAVNETFRATGRYLRGEPEDTDTTINKGIAHAMAVASKVIIVMLMVAAIPFLILLACVLVSALASICLYHSYLWDYVVTLWHSVLPISIQDCPSLLPVLVLISSLTIVFGVPVFALVRTIFAQNRNRPISSTSRSVMITLWCLALVATLVSGIATRIL